MTIEKCALDVSVCCDLARDYVGYYIYQQGDVIFGLVLPCGMRYV